MSSRLLALGISHKTAPLALRERLALPEGRAASVLRELVGHSDIHEAVAISTCNRTELYLVATDAVEAENAALAALSRQAGIPPTELLGSLYSLRGMDAVRHLFGVAAGLESMIVGEAEIQGQVKRAYELALVEGVTGPIVNRLFRDALATGKRARTETAIGRSRVSVSSVAVELARGIIGELDSRRVLVIGAGENGELTAKALRERGVETVFVANRRYDRAIGLAQRFGGQAVRFDDLPRELQGADIVVSSTGSPHQLVGREELELVMGERDGRPLLLIDIAVPRDIDPSVRELPGITLYDMDDLQREVARNLSGREAEVTRVHTIIEQEAERYGDWLASLDVVPTIAALRERGEEIVQRVLRDNEGRWESLSDADRQRVELLARAVVNRLLHEPTLRIKGAAERGGSYVQLQALRELFGLEPDAPEYDSGEGADVASLEERRRKSS
ncbi:MAG TPA: glutamyl-tRNA reductase [Thermoleophilaceae bacterium]|jgi:glutamyl-tRNA reductase|nr:glutamyl-tRNA reductase [Thermoleophilaceae bacterium]